MNFTKLNTKGLQIILPILLLVFSACRKELDLEEIRNALPPDESMEIPNSMIYSNLSLSVKEIEQQINEQLGETIYRDKDYQKRNGIKLKMTINRTGRIEMTGKDDLMFVNLPLSIKGRILINETFLGVKVRAEPGFSLNLDMLLSASIEFNDNYEFSLLSKIEEIKWPSKPVIRAGPISLDLSQAIESVIKENEQALAEIMEKSARKEMRMKRRIEKSVSKIKKSNHLKSKDISLWLTLEPKNIIINRRPEIKRDTIFLRGGMEVEFAISTEQVDSSNIDPRTLGMFARDSISKDFDIALGLSIPYKDLDSLLLSKVEKIDKSKLPDGITVKDISTGKYEKEQIWVLSDMEGKYPGQILTKGKLVFDTSDNTLRLNKIGMQYFGENWISSILFDFVSTAIKPQISENLRFPLDPLFERLQNSVRRVFQREVRKGNIDLDLENLNYGIDKINLKKEEIEILIRIQGQSEMQYHFM